MADDVKVKNKVLTETTDHPYNILKAQILPKFKQSCTVDMLGTNNKPSFVQRLNCYILWLKINLKNADLLNNFHLTISYYKMFLALNKTTLKPQTLFGDSMHWDKLNLS